MNTLKFITLSAIIVFITSCKKDNAPAPQSSYQQLSSIPIPNGDFENWNNLILQNWITNSCPFCVPAYETYIVRPDSNAYNGQLAVKFIYNNVYAAKAENKFSVPSHPTTLKAHIKCNLYGSDSVLVKINVFHNSILVDSGKWIGTSTISNYSLITIPVSQYTSQADTAIIFVQGGHKQGYPLNNTVLWVDDLELQ